jgi:hypothetical protein
MARFGDMNEERTQPGGTFRLFLVGKSTAENKAEEIVQLKANLNCFQGFRQSEPDIYVFAFPDQDVAILALELINVDGAKMGSMLAQEARELVKAMAEHESCLAPNVIVLTELLATMTTPQVAGSQWIVLFDSTCQTKNGITLVEVTVKVTASDEFAGVLKDIMAERRNAAIRYGVKLPDQIDIESVATTAQHEGQGQGCWLDELDTNKDASLHSFEQKLKPTATQNCIIRLMWFPKGASKTKRCVMVVKVLRCM